ncbi:hypothetical protein [Chakrabartyella piscis]|uniref:OmpH family outer membrane protein n=1 Tax=Chakrabartyella piscis TaxID=2918914 RepID=UPI00295858C1|nr:hypothetical protein [Chakrabartyella piscis]
MQNPQIKYVRGSNGLLFIFYLENQSIYMELCYGKQPIPRQMVGENVVQLFSLCQYQDMVYLLYATNEGTLILASSKDFTNWKYRVIMEEVPHGGRTKFFMVPMEDAFHIVYHMPTESTGVHSLVYTVFRGGEWEKPYQIDRFLYGEQVPFFARRLGREHIVLYYRTARTTWSAREMLLSPYTIGSLTPLIQTPTPCTDISVVNDEERIHVLYIVRNLFRTQVVYQYKQRLSISTPKVIWEDTNCDNCSVVIAGEKVILMWTVNQQPMRCISENNGTNFGLVERYTGDFPTRCFKGELITSLQTQIEETEIYGDYQRRTTPYLHFPEEQLYKKGDMRQNSTFTEKELDVTPKHQEETLHKEEQQMMQMKESHKKEMEALSTVLSQRNDEIAEVNARWQNQVTRMEQEIQKLRQENIVLQQIEESD